MTKIVMMLIHGVIYAFSYFVLGVFTDLDHQNRAGLAIGLSLFLGFAIFSIWIIRMSMKEDWE